MRSRYSQAFETVRVVAAAARRRVGRVFMSVVVGLAASNAAVAQVSTPLYPDDSVAAAEALPRIPELMASGNTPEAVRVLQSLLEHEADRVVVSELAAGVYESVRSRVHRLLLQNPGLLARYREIEGPRAESVAETDWALVERTRLLTPAGLRSALRVAQEHLESARFDAAGLTLDQLESHPDRVGEWASAAADLAGLLARYDVASRDRAARWARDAGRAAQAVTAVEPPADVRVMDRSCLAGGDAATGAATPRESLAEAPLARLATERLPAASSRSMYAWAMPLVRAGTVYVNDGVSVGAWDSATLVPLWRTTPPAEGMDRGLLGEAQSRPIGQLAADFEDSTWVDVRGGVLVAATGFGRAMLRREGDARIHALDAATGRVLWSVPPPPLDRQPDSRRSVRGPALIVGDTVVVTIGRLTGAQRVASVYMAGLDLSSGGTRWLRPLGSVGLQPASALPRAAEIAAVHRGVVYRADSIGVVAAVEAATGRPVWIRPVPPERNELDLFAASPPLPQPWSGAAPIVDDERVLLLDPARSDLMALDRATGRLAGTRARDDADRTRYLVGVGDRIALVASKSVSFVPAADPIGGALSTTTGPDRLFAGRATASGTKLLVPVSDGALLVDPTGRVEPVLVAMESPGNTVPLEGRFIVAGSRSLHTYMSWESAEPMLSRWMRERPTDVRPALTYIEIATRVNRVDRVPGVADRALAIIDEAPPGEAPGSTLASERRRLFELLSAIAESARLQWGDGAGAREGVLTPAVVDQVVARLGRAADSPVERVTHLLTVAWLREAQGRHVDAAEALQRVLVEDELSSASLPWRPGAPQRASEAARTGLEGLLMRRGYAAYEPFAAEAVREFAGVDAEADPAGVERLASRYPLARAAPAALARAASAYAAAGRGQDSTRALGSAWSIARTVARVAPGAGDAVLADVSGRLVESLTATGRTGEAARVLAGLAREFPALRLMTATGEATPGSLLQRLEPAMWSASPMPRVGSALTERAQALGGWVIRRPRLTEGAGQATDLLPLLSVTSKEIALFGPTPGREGLWPLWSRRFEDPELAPVFLRVDWRSAYVAWPGPRGVWVERVDAADGRTAWRTPEFSTLFPPEAAQRGQDSGVVIRTPTDGEVSAASMLAAMDGRTLVLAQRTGRLAAFSLADGKALWQEIMPPTEIYDLAIAGGRVVVIGLSAQDNRPVVASYDARSGEAGAPLAVGPGGDEQSALRGKPRWVRTAGDTVLIGLDDRVARWNPATGKVVWTVSGPPALYTGDCWVLGEWALVATGRGDLWPISLRSGAVPEEALQTHQRFDESGPRSRFDEREYSRSHKPTRLYERAGGGVVLVSGRGVVSYDTDWRVVGLDGRTGQRGLSAAGEDVVVMVTSEAGPEARGRGAADVSLLSSSTGKLLDQRSVAMSDRPTEVMALDGRVAITAGPVTIVVDVPVSGPR